MSTELTVTQRASAVLSFDETKAALLPLVEASARIVGITSGAGYAEAQSARMKLKSTRVEIEKRGKAAREDATAFSKAVIAKEKELIGVIVPEEDRLQSLQDEWDAAIAREKAAKAETERLRVFGIRQHIDALRALPLRAVGVASHVIADVLSMAAEPLTFDAQEFAADALAAQADAVAALTAALDAAKADEIRREAERVEREAEAARIAAERAELARLRAEQEKRDAEERAKIAAEREAARKAQDEADRKAAAEREAIAAAERAKQAEELRQQRAAEEQARAERLAAEAAERREREAREAAERAIRQKADDDLRELQRKEQAAIDARIAELAAQKAEQECIARQRELYAVTLTDAATDAHAFLDARFPAEFVTLKLGAALAREAKKPARKAAA